MVISTREVIFQLFLLLKLVDGKSEERREGTKKKEYEIIRNETVKNLPLSQKRKRDKEIKIDVRKGEKEAKKDNETGIKKKTIS